MGLSGLELGPGSKGHGSSGFARQCDDATMVHTWAFHEVEGFMGLRVLG